jgi:hypothetical protein
MAKIYATNDRYESNVIKVFLVDSQYDADLLFYKVSDRYDADNKDELWYFTDDKYDSTAKIYWVDSRYDADVLVYQVDSRYDAKWNKGNQFVGRFS